MNKKLFAAAGLAISFVIGLFCMVNSFSAFGRSVLTEKGEDIAAGVFHLLFGLALLALAIAGVALLIVSFIRKKEFKVPFVAILTLASAGVLLAYCIMVSVLDIKLAVQYFEDLGQGAPERYETYYVLGGMTALLDMFTMWFIGFIVTVLGVFSLINIKFKKKNPAPEPVEEKPVEEAKPAE